MDNKINWPNEFTIAGIKYTKARICLNISNRSLENNIDFQIGEIKGTNKQDKIIEMDSLIIPYLYK